MAPRAGRSLKKRPAEVHLGALLKFWSDLGRPVGYSEDGPIIRALRIIHESLEIPAPKGEAIRQVINDFKGRPRASKKKAGKGKHI